MKFLYKKGFTLVELLVVIAIISLISSVILASLNSARAKARDANRTASIRQVQTALELYYDANDSYPSSPDVGFPGILTSALTPTYISQIPVNSGVGPYRYYTAAQNPATFYAIFIPYETKSSCYVCNGSFCPAIGGFWSVNMCQ